MVGPPPRGYHPPAGETARIAALAVLWAIVGPARAADLVARWDAVPGAVGYEVLECSGPCATWELAATGPCATPTCARPFARPVPSPALALGARVVVSASQYANVRSGPDAWDLLGTQPRGATGRVVGGPATKPSGSIYWQVDFDAGPDGWASEGFVAATGPPVIRYRVVAFRSDGTRQALNEVRADLTTPGVYRPPAAPGPPRE